MRLRFESLGSHIQNPLLPIYWISGDEPFQVDEACKLLRQAAQQQGYSERQVYHVERGFNWDQLRESADSLSLFAERKLIELRLPSGKPGTDGSKALQDYAKSAPADTLLLIVSGKLESAAQKSKWFTAIESAGAWLAIWPIETARLPQWIAQRMQLRQQQATPEALRLLSERIEGNLLAADQELEKLLLLYGPGTIDVPQVQAAVTDSARFDIFGFVDEALDGQHERVARILFGLRGEGVEPVLVLWALEREIRALAQMARNCAGGQSPDQAMAAYHVWEKRKPLIRKALSRSRAPYWESLLTRCGQLDRLIKGQGTGRVWDELLELALSVAGQPALTWTKYG
ncbi:MAG: DNA polymerase III subunit delta [Gammaproteobacteria bacterium]|nr:DNA polymerase III subunit delta [Gammaproteobacteria bacterium]